MKKKEITQKYHQILYFYVISKEEWKEKHLTIQNICEYVFNYYITK
jgi:hypothetical protein